MNKLVKYRQIDFLRLFRLCRNIGAVKRKRKMPVEYADNDDGALRGASKRLLRVLIKHLFSDFEISSSYGTYFITLPTETKSALSFIETHSRDYFSTVGQQGILALEKYSEIRQTIGGHVVPSIPYEIKVYMKSIDRQSPFHVAMQSGTKSKPAEDFSRCAEACAQYKELWDRNIPFLIDFVKEESIKEKERAVEVERTRKARIKREAEEAERERKEKIKQEKIQAELLKRLEADAEKQRVERINNAQSLFDSALQSYKSTRSD
jgi:hypothetical protein